MVLKQKKKNKKTPKKVKKIDWLLVFEGIRILVLLIIEILRRL